MYFRFMDDIMFFHNGPMEACRYCSSDAADSNVPRCLMRPILEDGGHQDESFLRGVPGAESAMRHCLVQRQLRSHRTETANEVRATAVDSQVHLKERGSSRDVGGPLNICVSAQRLKNSAAGVDEFTE